MDCDNGWQRRRRVSQWWWTLFALLGWFAFALVAFTDDAHLLPWLFIALQVAMIYWRKRCLATKSDPGQENEDLRP